MGTADWGTIATGRFADSQRVTHSFNRSGGTEVLPQARALSINPQACELVHIHLRSSGTGYGSRKDQAMTQLSMKRIPQWLAIDSLVIVVGIGIIWIGMIWIAP